ncbi:hypothetical protein CC80DRAFT_504735 [Byssothecium circinans]|uniref:Uncharacterized protein n=1 Tax=Byssothecium circinans TaxID=147558 RepID=A0A6A5TU47_9PLEO|nr:hypothetical protein CC80DRAFT_504735 [Byssothecium circinans]
MASSSKSSEEQPLKNESPAPAPTESPGAKEELSDQAKKAIMLISGGVVFRVNKQLVQALTDLNGVYTRAKMDEVLTNLVERSPLYRMGIKKTIVIPISEHLPSGASSLTLTAAVPGKLDHCNKNIVPNKIIMKPDGKVTKDASKLFAADLKLVVESDLASKIIDHGPVVAELFQRQQHLHRKRHKMDDSEPCCIFRILEEDYIMNVLDPRNIIMDFSFECILCKSRHQMCILSRRQ